MLLYSDEGTLYLYGDFDAVVISANVLNQAPLSRPHAHLEPCTHHAIVDPASLDLLYTSFNASSDTAASTK